MTNQLLILDYIRTEILHDAGCSIGVDDELLLDGVLDSLAVMRLVAFLEANTGTAIPPEDVTLENFRSIGAIAAYLDQPSASP
ncbi:MAG: acyl carrier protein [Gammaproteobacteria bacterium]|nr:acyl carrier protein [Gammaproteobacteria bacterium]NNC58207.1 acyl carrier protein [Woeseiaceae bacterium]